jgi:hypothetical protein
MGDADLTYDFDEIPKFVEKLDAGAELVMGDRMENIHPGAMPWHHRYIGNPVLTGILNLFFRTGVRDAPSSATRPSSVSRVPAWYSPRSSRSRKSKTTRSVREAAAASGEAPNCRCLTGVMLVLCMQKRQQARDRRLLSRCCLHYTSEQRPPATPNVYTRVRRTSCAYGKGKV